MKYLVRVIPQRGFETRRRAGVVFSVEGTVVDEADLGAAGMEAVRADPGLIITPVRDEEAAVIEAALTDRHGRELTGAAKASALRARERGEVPVAARPLEEEGATVVSA